MVSRRQLLHAGAAALLAAVAGCQAGGNRTTSTTEPTTTTTTATTRGPTPTGGPRVDATEVGPREVPDGATVAVASPALHELVVEAAAADQRVDYVGENPGDAAIGADETLALGGFAYLRFRGGTYRASSAYAHAYEEAPYQYSLVEVNESAVEDDRPVVTYADLNESERAVATTSRCSSTVTASSSSPA